MPLFEYKCSDCLFEKEHFVSHDNSKKKECPDCGSKAYSKQISSFALNIEYKNIGDIMEHKIDPSVREIQAKIGKETLDQDTKTLDNIYGSEKVKDTFYERDD